MDHQAFAQLLGNYGEFVGSLAVVFTLAFLAVQMRDSRKALDASTKQREAESLNHFSQSISEWMLTVFGNAELSDLMIRGREGEQLEPRELERFIAVASQFFVRNRSVYASAIASGNDGQAEMTVIGTAFSISIYPGMNDVWENRQRYLAELVVPEFVSAVEARLKTMSENR